MKKLFYLLAIVIFISSCSTSQFTKKNFNGDRLSYSHKDVTTSQVAKVVDEPSFVAKRDLKTNESVSISDKIDIKAARKSIKAIVKANNQAERSFDRSEIASNKVVGDIVSAKSFEKTIIEKAYESADSNSWRRPDKALLFVLAFFLPWLAVGLSTNWDINKVLVNILLTMLCGIPGIIHAMIVVSKGR